MSLSRQLCVHVRCSCCRLPACGQIQHLQPRPHPARPPACRIVAAGCLGESECIVRSSIDVFEDACPGTPKTLTFGYK